MTPENLPIRFQLTPAEVSTCFARLQKLPAALPMFAELPVAEPHLPGAVTGAPGQLSQEAAEIFSILAAPQRVTTIRLVWPDVGLPLETTILGGGQAGLVLVARGAEGQWDLARLANATQAAILIEGIFPLTDAAPRAPEVLAKLPASGLGVLAALADRLRDLELRASLARRALHPEDVMARITADEVALYAGRGLSSPDLRCATGRFLLLAPEALGAVADRTQAEVALDGLRAAGMIETDGGPSARGLALMRVLNDARPSATLHGAHVAGKTVRNDRIMFLRSGESVLTAHWGGAASDPTSSVTVAVCPPAEALRVLETALSG